MSAKISPFLIPSALELVEGIIYGTSCRAKHMDALVIGISNYYIVIPCPQSDGWQWDFHAIVLGYHQKGSVHLIATLGKSPSLLSFGKAKQAWLSAHLIATLGKSPNESNFFTAKDVDAGAKAFYGFFLILSNCSSSHIIYRFRG